MKMLRVVLVMSCFIISGCLTPRTEYWVLQGNVVEIKSKLAIDNVAVFLSADELTIVNHTQYTNSSGVFRHYPYSTELFSFNDLKKVTFNFKFSRDGYISVDTMILGSALRYGTEGNYEDTLYLDSIFLNPIP